MGKSLSSFMHSLETQHGSNNCPNLVSHMWSWLAKWATEQNQKSKSEKRIHREERGNEGGMGDLKVS